MKCFIFLAIILMLFFSRVKAQAATDADSVIYELAPITVTAFRFSEEIDNIPFSVSHIDAITLHSGRQGLSLRETVGTIPGLFSLNSYNFSQDLRVSIRGFGARGAFGIRGIKILIDGIPETTADGQTTIDNLNLHFIESMEVIRGPVSALYGNASGGVISLSTISQFETPFIDLRLSGGAYGFRQWQINSAQRLGSTRLLLSAIQTHLGGYRQNSAMEAFLLNSTLHILSDSLSDLTVRMNVEYNPDAQDPGGLTAAEARENPGGAAATNVYYAAGESVKQGQAGLYYRRHFAEDCELSLSLAYAGRKFENSLPFSEGGFVRLNRHYYRASLLYKQGHRLFGLKSLGQTGLDAALQNDHRKRFNNLKGTAGEQVFNQKEIYKNIGIFLQEQIDLIAFWRLNLGLRYDLIETLANDFLNGANSEANQRTFRGPSAMVGLSCKISAVTHLYGNISSGFETPTLIELTNNPGGTSGLNPGLTPQHLLNLESGIKSRIFNRFRYELAVFHIDVTDELLPYELAGEPGRTFYQNAGRSIHRGIETALAGPLGYGISFSLAYTFSDFYFVDFPVDGIFYDGNRIPGIPRHNFFSELLYGHASGLYARLEIQGTGKIYMDNANQDRQEGYWLVNTQIGWPHHIGDWRLEPYLGINNLFGTAYADNIRINAFGLRYIEPAPPLNIYAGLSVRYEFPD